MGTGAVEIPGARNDATGLIDGKVKQGYTGDAADYRVKGSGPLTTPKDREHATLTTTAENGTFTSTENVTTLTFKLFITAQATTATDADQALATAFVTFDPPTDAIGDLWLTQGDHTSDNSKRKRIAILEPLTVDAPSYFTSYRIKAGHLPAGMTIGCSVEAN